jgi:hypothetical protein
VSGASTATAVKNHVETLGLGLAAYRDGAPTNDSGEITAAFPHVVIQEGIGYATMQHGDFGDPNADDAMIELVQVDLFQHARVLTPGGVTQSVNVESYTLPEALRRGLHGAQLGAVGDRRVYGVRVTDGRRWPIADNIVRHTFTVAISRRT